MMLQWLLPIFFVFFPKENPRLELEIEHIASDNGKLWVAVYRSNDDFGAENPNIFKIVPVTSKKNLVVSFELASGKYAVAVYHDLNNNEKLDKNFIGIPKEPYGFSNNFRPKFAPPKFSDCAFELPESGKRVRIKLTN